MVSTVLHHWNVDAHPKVCRGTALVSGHKVLEQYFNLYIIDLFPMSCRLASVLTIASLVPTTTLRGIEERIFSILLLR